VLKVRGGLGERAFYLIEDGVLDGEGEAGLAAASECQRTESIASWSKHSAPTSTT
jgi:hypothetical protein